MAQLFFKKAMQVAIREGRKRTTLRRWNEPQLRAGREAFSPGLGWLAVERVEPVDLNALGLADARADGFTSLAELREVLFSLYPDHVGDGKRWFRVCFTMSRPVTPRRRRVGKST